MSRLRQQEFEPLLELRYLQRGKSYCQQGHVEEINEVSSTRITGLVRGKQSSPYRVDVQLVRQHDRLMQIRGNCSCPVGYNCKHVAALLYCHTRKNTKKRNLVKDPSDRWLYQLKAIKSQDQETDASNQLLLYLLYLNNTLAGPSLHVKPVKVRQLKNGEYSAVERISMNPHSTARYMREEDKFTLMMLQSLKGDHLSQDPKLAGAMGYRALMALIDTGRCHWQNQLQPVIRHGRVEKTRLCWQLQPDASQKIQARDLSADFHLLPLDPPSYMNAVTGDCGQLDCGLSAEEAAVLLSSPCLSPEKARDVRSFLLELDSAQLPLPAEVSLHSQGRIEPKPILRLCNDDTPAYLRMYQEHTQGVAWLTFNYWGQVLTPRSKLAKIIRQQGQHFEQCERNYTFEASCIEKLDLIGLIYDEFDQPETDGFKLEPVHASETWYEFLLHRRQELEEQGWVIEISDDFAFQVTSADSWYADVFSSSEDWFNLDLGIMVGEEKLNLLPLLINYLQHHQLQYSDLMQAPDERPVLISTDDGRLLNLPMHQVRHILATLVELYDRDSLNASNQLQLSRLHGIQLNELANGNPHMVWQGGEKLRAIGQQVADFKGVTAVEPPSLLRAELRDYQREGLSWLQFLREYQLGGILADDMGLGKTIQALAHILVEIDSGRQHSPTLVVAPTSLMLNWRREAERFTPHLRVLVLQGPERKQFFDQFEDYDLVLTTYPLLSRDAKPLLQQPWHGIILDEAQHIKNPRSKAAQTATQLNAGFRLCLTGTPMENHLGELWSQFNFLMPGYLGDERQFRQLFRNPVEKQQDESRQQQLNRRVAPFMLRREKSSVAQELPPKTEIITEVELVGAQRDLYETIRLSLNQKVRQAILHQGFNRSQIMILDALLKLRQVCCHPGLLKMESAQSVKQSAKLQQLLEMLPEMIEEGRKVLLFSQFTSMLAIIEQELHGLGIDYVKLTGQTRNREKPIDDFQDGEVPLFLISLKAGGSGLNLTAADTVIHYDPWWNPAVERQATDRAHRIGQDKPVFVYKMITSGTVEQKILELQNRKQALADALFSEKGSTGSLSQEDLQALFEPLQ